MGTPAEPIRNRRVFLIGNPNSGKTSLFNALTGENYHVGNWPGVTVERREGSLSVEDQTFALVDLPGSYSLFPLTPEEEIVLQNLDEAEGNLIINVVDASSLERNLVLTLQLLELGLKPMIALNCFDLFQKKGGRMNLETLSRLLGVPVIPTVARTQTGTAALASSLACTRLPQKITPEATLPEAWQSAAGKLLASLGSSWEAARPRQKLDAIRSITLRSSDESPELEAIRQQLSLELQKSASPGSCPSIAGNLASNRFQRILQILHLSGYAGETSEDSTLAKADRILTHPLWGYPFFFLLMGLVFWSTFTLGQYPADAIKSLLASGISSIQASFPESLWRSLITDGIITGVGGVLSFLPMVMILFFWLSLLEDSGYMSRAAFLMDRPMRAAGLHGRAFLPLVVGFGCNVPAIMSTRIISSPAQRLLTILVLPLIGCSARLPVLVLFCGAFFPENPGLWLFLLYFLNFSIFLGTSRLLRRFFPETDTSPFLLELPVYRLPTLQSIWRTLWEKLEHFLEKAGTIILAGSIVIFCLASLPREVDLSRNYTAEIIHLQTLPISSGLYSIQSSVEAQRDQELLSKRYLGRLGALLQPLVEPLGFGWREAISLIPGFLAKESIVSTLSVLYRPVGPNLPEALKHQGMTPLRGLVFMVFTLLYVPCLATIGAIFAETRSWSFTGLALLIPAGIAWGVSFLIFRLGLMLHVLGG